MAVETTNAFSGPFLPNGVTKTFPFTFTAPSVEEVGAVLRSADGQESAAGGFNVILADGGGGSITFDVAPAAGPELYVILEPHFTQQIQFENGAGWLAEPVNEVADRSAARDQVLRRDLGRSLLVPLGEGFGVLPPALSRAGRFLAFDATGAPVMASGGGSDGDLRGDIADSSGDGGAALAGYQGASVASRLNILSATRRPAMDGIFSSGTDQRAALLAFIANAATDGQTIEWGPLDVSLDAATATGGRRGLTVPTGSRWVFHPNTVIRAIPGAASSYEIVNLWDVSDVVIEGAGARIVGERAGHVGASGEWGMGVSLRGCTGVTIRDLNTEDCWGDGFYVGVGTQAYCENILLENVTSKRARRNGLSVISVKGLRCIDCEFSDTNGTAPQFGVDIEPNATTDFLQGILFERLRTSGNVGYGIGVALQALVGTSNPIDIRIVDHFDDGSVSGIIGSTDPGIAGRVDIVRPISINAKGPALILRRKASNGPLWTITDPTAIDWNRSASANTVTSSGIVIYAPNGDAGTEALGNVDIVRPKIMPLASGSASNAIAIAEQRTTTPDNPEKIRIIDPVNLAGLPSRLEGVATFTDPSRVSARKITDAAASITNNPYYRHVAMEVTAGTRYFDIADAAKMAIGTEFVFELMVAGGEGRVRFAVGVSLFPDAVGANRYIGTSVKGSRLRIRKTAASEWMIVEKVGTWATG